MPPSSALSLPVSAAPARQLSRANRPRKRKSIAEQLSFFAPAASVNMLHKTDGSHTNRPFFRSLCRTCGKPPFLRKTPFPAVSFVSFLQEKKSFPYPFLFRKKKTVGLRGKRSPLDGRTLAHPALSSVGIPQRVCLPPPPCLCPCPPRLRASFPVQTDHAKENQLRNSFPSPLLLLPSTCCTKRTVQMRTVRFSVPSRTCGKPPFLRKTSAPAVSFVSFLQEKKTSPPLFKEKKSSPLLFARRAA